MRSIWEQTARLPQFDALTGGVQTDVLIIGGGMAGILCAYFLEQAGVDYLLLEADRICGGVTGNTTAKITSQHGLIYSRLAREFGLEAARLYLEANEAALARYRSLCREIDCDFQEQDAYVYSRGRRDKLENEVAVLEQLGVPARLVSDLPLPIPAAGAVRFPGQAQFHPLRFIAAIARGLRIHEHTKVLSLRDGEAVTSGGTVRAGKVVAATHFPLLNRHGSYFLKLCQHRSYVLALRGAPELEGMYVDEAEDGLSLRSYHGLLLLGGGGHRTGKKGGGWAELSAVAQRAYPNAREAARWATQDCMSLDGVPYIGQYSARTPGLFVAAGFNKWGMTSSMVAALLLTDFVLKRNNPWAQVFAPNRTVLRPQLAVHGWESAASLLTPTVPRCPHMGCALKYNPQEHSWDCPCHGSRFQEDGKLIDNPATDDKRM